MNHDNLDRALNATPDQPQQQPTTGRVVAAYLIVLTVAFALLGFVLWLAMR